MAVSFWYRKQRYLIAVLFHTKLQSIPSLMQFNLTEDPHLYGLEMPLSNILISLENSFPVPTLCKFNHIKVCFFQITTKLTRK